MSGFMLRFLISNLFLSVMLGILLLLKWLFHSSLSPRMQYRLWFLFLGALAAPFLPFHMAVLPQIFPWLKGFGTFSASNIGTAAIKAVNKRPGVSISRLPDFTVNISAHSHIGSLLCVVWVAGMLVMLRFMVKSLVRLRALTQSALPLQNPEVRSLYQNCLREAGAPPCRRRQWKLFLLNGI